MNHNTALEIISEVLALAANRHAANETTQGIEVPSDLLEWASLNQNHYAILLRQLDILLRDYVLTHRRMHPLRYQYIELTYAQDYLPSHARMTPAPDSLLECLTRPETSHYYYAAMSAA